MLIDLHAHSTLSKCCRIDGKDALVVTKENGMDGFVLTNHYDRDYLVNGDMLEYAKRYIDEFYYVKDCATKLGMKAFFGVEITMLKHNNAHILLYGIEPEFLLDYPNLYDYELNDLYELVHKYNAILVQAHPFRENKNCLQDLNFLDGIEANCNSAFDGPHLEEVLAIVKKNNKILTCGGDFHDLAPREKCGIFLPENVNETIDIVNYLKVTKDIKFCFQLGKTQDTCVEYIYSNHTK